MVFMCSRLMFANNKIINMLQKTQMSQVSTAPEQPPTSLFTHKNRQMIKPLKKNQQSPKQTQFLQISNGMIANDLLVMHPKLVGNLAWPQVHIVDNEFSMCVRGNYYEVTGMAGISTYLQRNSQVDSELLYFQGDKPAKHIILSSLERYKVDGEIWCHLNLTKYQTQTEKTTSQNFHLNCHREDIQTKLQVIWDFQSLQLIENHKKALIFFKVHWLVKGQISASNVYRVVITNLVPKRRKGIVPEKQILQLVGEEEFVGEAGDNFSREKLIKTVKSQFGDIVLMVTSNQIYEIQIEESAYRHLAKLKPFKLGKIFQPGEKVLDCNFMSNGLKVILLTSHDRLLCYESQNFLCSLSLRQVLDLTSLPQFYHLDKFSFSKVYSINGAIGVKFHSDTGVSLCKPKLQISYQQQKEPQKITLGLLLFKMQDLLISFSKIVSFPIDNSELQHLSILSQGSVDQILVQYIDKKSPYQLQVMRVGVLMSELNAFTRLGNFPYNYTTLIKPQNSSITLNSFQSYQLQKRYTTASAGVSSRVFYLINDKQLTCLKLFREIDIPLISKQLSNLFTYTFFQKPIKITISSCTQHLVIVFKEFVKFFYFDYSTVKNYYTLKIKNVGDVKYSPQGHKVYVAIGNVVHTIDPYTFQEEFLLETNQGDITEMTPIDSHNIIIKSYKGYLSLYNKGLESQNKRDFVKKYQVKLEEGDLYTANLKNLIMFKKSGIIQAYGSQSESISDLLPIDQRQCYMQMRARHPYLVNRKTCLSFSQGQQAIQLLLCEKLGFLFVITNKGNLKQYFYPLMSATNPNPPQVYTQHISNRAVLSMSLEASFSHLCILGQDGNLSRFEIRQYINGQAMPHVYLMNPKWLGQEQQKREFTDRDYLLDNFTPTETALTLATQQTFDQLQFLVDKLKDDMEEMIKTHMAKGRKNQQQFKGGARQTQGVSQEDLRVQKAACFKGLQGLIKDIQQNSKKAKQEQNSETQKYQKTLLELYRQTDRLQKIKKDQDKKMTEERKVFQIQYQKKLQALNLQKEAELKILRKEYDDVIVRRDFARRQNQILDEEQQAQMRLFKIQTNKNLQDEHLGAEQEKERLLGDNTRQQKGISNFKQRAIYFQNLILQTRLQINELEKDRGEYERRKQYLQGELRGKQDIIEKIQRELVIYLSNTEDMKTIKNTHEFELQEYEKQVGPISSNFKKIEENIKQMNKQIMHEYNNKVERQTTITQKQQKIQQLKKNNQQRTLMKLQKRNKVNRVLEEFIRISNNPFRDSLRVQLRAIFGQQQHSTNDMIKDQGRQKDKRELDNLIRAKNLLRKQIEEEQKRQEHIQKNSHEFYMHHNEHTALLREYNDLKKKHRNLNDEHHQLKSKVQEIKLAQLNTPLRRVPSLSLKKQHKMTPFQRYEQEQSALARKQQDTIDTRATSNQQSMSFLKGLMREVGNADSHYQKRQIMRERVRTFVNPELRGRTDQLKKIIAGRSRGTSQLLKLT